MLIHIDTEPFVDTVIKVLKEKTFVHSAITKSTANGSQSRPGATPFAVAIPPIEFEPRSLQTTSTPPFGVLEGPTVGALSAFHHRPNRPTGSEPSPSVVHGIEAHYKGKAKRKLFERELSQPHEDEHKYHGLHGTMRKKAKQATRRERVNAEKRLVQNSFLQKSFPTFDSIPGPAYPQQQLPPPPPGLPPFDPSDPVAFMTMAAAFGVNILDMPPLPFAVPQRDEHNHQGPKLKCEAYHTKGFCVVGSACLYEHGGEIVIPADSLPDYTHGRASLKLQANQAGNGVVRENTSHNQSHSGRVGRSRAPFSVSGPNYDPSNTTLVVEQIPEDFASEDDVRSFFSSFGSITEVSMHAHKRLAVVKFNDHDTANRAYMSPKAVFDNRFVKVYWYRSDAELGAHKARFGDVHVGGMKQHQDDEREDPKEIAKRQAEAQKAFEERRRKTEEAAARAEEIDRQLDEKEEEMRIIREQLAEISGDQEDQQTLATLQAEAEDLFATHEPEAPAGRGRGSFRGNYRGRAAMTFAPHGRGAPFRGAYRGRGSGARYPSRSSVKRLDYRPRRLAVAGIEVNSSRDEALRQHLIVSWLRQMLRLRILTTHRTFRSAPVSSAIPNYRLPSSSPSRNVTRLKYSSTHPAACLMLASWTCRGFPMMLLVVSGLMPLPKLKLLKPVTTTFLLLSEKMMTSQSV